jgi:hypothetical protein
MNHLSIGEIPRSDVFTKGDRLSLPQFFLAHQGFQIDRKKTKSFYRFKKLPPFIDSTATKTGYSMLEEPI